MFHKDESNRPKLFSSCGNKIIQTGQYKFSQIAGNEDSWH